MKGRCAIAWGRLVLCMVLLPVSIAVVAACGSSSAASGAPDATATPVAPVSPSTDQPNLASAGVIKTLEDRIAAMNRGDGLAAAACYTPNGVLEETDLTPHLVSRGRAELATRFTDLYSMGLRLAPAGAPIINDRYVAEPTRFYNGNAPGRGAAMLVFEIAAGDRLAYQWMIGWAGGPEKTFAIVTSPTVDKPNLPPPGIMTILNDRMAAMNRGDARAAASFYARNGAMEEMDQSPSLVTKGRTAIEARLDDLYQMGLRLAPAGAPITYDQYVAEPVRFSNGNGAGEGAGMLVFQFDPASKIVHEWVIGWLSD
jgi:hypothetical protein